MLLLSKLIHTTHDGDDKGEQSCGLKTGTGEIGWET
jgi:hypothetical protein